MNIELRGPFHEINLRDSKIKSNATYDSSVKNKCILKNKIKCTVHNEIKGCGVFTIFSNC